MQLPQHLIPEIQRLIAASKEAAIRSVDHQRVLLYWNIGKTIFEEEQGAKDRADYGAYLISSFRPSWSRFMARVFRAGNWSFSASFTELSQLRTHCVRNSVGHIIGC